MTALEQSLNSNYQFPMIRAGLRLEPELITPDPSQDMPTGITPLIYMIRRKNYTLASRAGVEVILCRPSSKYSDYYYWEKRMIQHYIGKTSSSTDKPLTETNPRHDTKRKRIRTSRGVQ